MARKICDDSIVSVIHSQGSALLLLTKEGQVVDLFSANGLVHRLRLYQGGVTVDYLTFKEMAQLRVDQFESQLVDLSNTE